MLQPCQTPWACKNASVLSCRARRRAPTAAEVVVSSLVKSAPGGAGGAKVGEWRCPTLLNNVPHGAEVRQYFHADCAASVVAALDDGKTRVRTFQQYPETNVEMDTYRIGTLLEFIRHLANCLTADGRRVRVCVQGSMGTGVFTAMPLALNGVRRILESMDWGDAVNDLLDERNLLRIGGISAGDVQADDDIFVLIAPQNMNGHSIMPLLNAFCDAAGTRPVILVNPLLTDIPSANGVMSVRGRAERMQQVAAFEEIYHFRLIYNKPNIWPIYGCLRKPYGGPWEVYKRTGAREQEAYQFAQAFATEPGPPELTDAIRRGD